MARADLTCRRAFHELKAGHLKRPVVVRVLQQKPSAVLCELANLRARGPAHARNDLAETLRVGPIVVDQRWRIEIDGRYVVSDDETNSDLRLAGLRLDHWIDERRRWFAARPA